MRATLSHPLDGAPGGPDAARWGWFAAWTLIGVAIGIGLIVFPAGVVVVALAGFLMYRRNAARAPVFGVISGVGAVLLIVAWIQRQGPGTTCWHTATASGCEQHLDPIPWLVAGIVLLVAGVVATWRSRG